MNLPITESILRGELRPNILQEYLDQDELKQLIRDARQLTHKSQLIELEAIINKVLNGLVDTKDIYSEDKKIRNAAISACEKNILKVESKFQNINSEVVLSDILNLPDLNTPLLRLYNTLLDAEILRTRLAILYLCRAVRDDAFMRTTLKELFRKIKNFCTEAAQWEEHKDVMSLIPIKLTNLYFSLYHTYIAILTSCNTIEDDFMDFVYEWKGEYPSQDEESKYNQECNKRTDIAIIPQEIPEPHQTGESDKPIRIKDKADIFLENVEEFNFMEMPKIKVLLTPDKVHRLVLTMLDNPSHACAMLEYLGFYNWIKDTQRAKFTMKEYETLCSRIVMGIENSQAFHHVRMSLNSNNKAADKYQAYKYVGQVDHEYNTLLNN